MNAVVHLTIVTLAWGVLSFGAVYPWAFWPLAAAAQGVGIIGVWLERRSDAGASRALTVGLLVFAAAIFLQLVPVPLAVIDRLSPETTAALKQLDPLFAVESSSKRALSLAPSDTLTALALYMSFALLMVGTSRVLSRVSPHRLCSGLVALGVVVALIGIIQKPLYTGRIYGFWQPYMSGDVFGPFVNRNHFAGWMLLIIPVSIGLLLSRMAKGMRGVSNGWRDRLLWIGSAEASQSMLLAAAIVVMALSLVLTMSRSGIGALALSVLLAGSFLLRHSGAISSRFAGLAYLVLLVFLVTGWAGVDTIAERFSQSNWKQANDRLGAWADAIAIAARFPLAGAGLNTYGTASLLYQKHDLAQHYAEAHNEYLQLLAEGGLLLALPALVCLAFFGRDVLRRFREDCGTSSYWIRAGAVISIVAIALQSIVEFSLQMPGNAALFAVICGIALHKGPGRREALVQSTRREPDVCDTCP